MAIDEFGIKQVGGEASKSASSLFYERILAKLCEKDILKQNQLTFWVTFGTLLYFGEFQVALA